MRPLALAGILASLVGCSVNYEGTSFKAAPVHKHAIEGEHTEGEHAAAEHGEEATPVAESAHAESVDDSVTPSKGIGKTLVAFPPTAQPTGLPPVPKASSGE